MLSGTFPPKRPNFRRISQSRTFPTKPRINPAEFLTGDDSDMDTKNK
ncbi:MAG: hypothetical protein Q8881_03850 [Sweet potato little leaf phytoplasma]|nr:hypothetical protein [Sweet potato little leaf phytoplasma]